MEDKKMNMEEIALDPDKIITCCLCGKQIPWRESSNPWPLVDDEESRCCHDCDDSKVIPARLQRLDTLEDKITDYYFDKFESSKKGQPDSLFRAVLRKGFEKIGVEDDKGLILWTGYVMGISSQREEELSRMVHDS